MLDLMDLVARMWGIDVGRVLDYLEDPSKYHDQEVKEVDAEAVMP